MNMRNLWVVALFLLAGTAGIANAATPVPAADPVPLAEMTARWLPLLRSGEPAVRSVAAAALAEIVRKHPAAAIELVQWMATEENGGVAAEHERCLVPLAKESPATVSAFLRLIRDRGTNYRARNFAVKVLSQVGPAVATSEFVESLSETYCPVPGAHLRIMRALGKDAAPILTAGFRHPNANVRKWATIGLRVIGRTEPTIQKLFDALQAESLLLKKMGEGTPMDRVAAVAALAELARTTPGTATALVNALNNVSDKDVLAEAESRLVVLGRESHEVVAALLAGVRSEGDYRLRRLAMKVLPKVGANLNCTATVEALGDHHCPVPGAMRLILIKAGSDALPVLGTALTHANADIRRAAEVILQRMPRPATEAVATPKP
jgi:HEAT repeat protein